MSSSLSTPYPEMADTDFGTVINSLRFARRLGISFAALWPALGQTDAAVQAKRSGHYSMSIGNG